MSTDNFKQDVHAQLARVGKALSHGNRLKLLDFVAQGPRSVEELAAMTRLSVANRRENNSQAAGPAGISLSHSAARSARTVGPATRFSPGPGAGTLA